MRSTLCLLATVAVAAAPCHAQTPPAPPAPNAPRIDDFRYTDDKAAQAAWKPMQPTADVCLVNVAGKNLLRMPCNFKATDIERASWDRTVSLDLAACQGIQFRLFCRDASPVSHWTCYFQSGGGWYAIPFSPGPNAQWNTVPIDKDKARIEETPAGWRKIETIRISAWRGQNTDTEFYLADVALLGADAPIAVVRADSAAKTAPTEAKSAREFAQAMARHLKDLSLAHCTMSDQDVTAERLRGKAIVILPYNPGMPDPVADEIAKFVESSGKLVSFYSLHRTLRPITAIDGGQHIKQDRPGHFASIHIAGDVLGGAPPVVQQQSWNITEAKPVEGKSRVAARWFDDNQKDTGHAAVVASDNCIQMTHVLLPDDPSAKCRLLLAMIGHFAPELWRQSVQATIQRIGKLGPYNDFDKARKEIPGIDPHNKRVLNMMDRAADLRKKATSLCATGKFPEATAAAEEAHTLMTDAYCCAQTPLAGEHRAFWCHSAFGVSGMTWDQAIKTLADNGFTAILPNMLWGGTAYYESRVLPVAPEVNEKGDQIAQCLAACKKHGLECHVWKVNYNMSGRAPKAFVEKMKAENRTQVRHDGLPYDRWLCPSHPENQKLEIDSMVEVAARYDVHGIHFDYIRYPGSHCCFCSGCRQRFEKTIGTAVPNWPADVRTGGELKTKWLDFRRQQITTVVADVAKAARKARPNVKISAAVFRNWPTDRDTVGQDWKLWCEKGYLDFVCPMNYTPDSHRFERMIEHQLPWVGNVPCYPGIGLSTWKPADDICKLIEQINITRSFKTGGFTVFNYGPNEADKILPLCGKGITRKK